MFLLLPWSTDAPIYHWPIATGVIIGVNVVVFVLQLLIPDLTDVLIMNYGELNPLTWITAVYAHAGFAHIIGNMIFLFTFGIVVEGKIGWWRFAILYNLIGFLASMLIALIMYFAGDGGGLGASCAIFGTMTIAMIWAPENEISIKGILVIFFRPYIFDFDISILAVAFWYIGSNFFFAAISGFAMSSEVAHLLGVLPAAVLGVAMILLRWVDCEGFDLVARLRGRRGVRVKTVQQEAADKKHVAEEKERVAQEYQTGMKMCVSYLNAGHYEMAQKRFDAIRKLKPGLVMPEKWLVKLIKAATSDGEDTAKSVSLMREYLKHYQPLRVTMTLRIARFLTTNEERPRKAIKELAQIRSKKMTKQQAAAYNSIAKQAKAMVADGVIELDELS